MTVSEIVNEIIAQDCVEEVIKILLDILIRTNAKAKNDLREARASLRAIHKINAGVDHSVDKKKTIEVLSEV